MSESTPNTQNGGEGNSNQAGAPPSLVVVAQYLKDLSFENPRAPAAFAEQSGPPQIAVDVNVNARGLENNLYEVELSVSASARHGQDLLFVVETTYAGAFDIRNVPADQLEPIMLIECPRILFPFMRQIVADATRNGNFPPLMLEPIDFFAVYQQRMRQQAEAGAQPATA
jgi:preprotein translocase subunit SecB